MKNDGRPFQQELERVLLQYQSAGLLRVRKVDPPVRVVGFGARRQVIFQKNPWLDYAGVWTERSGRAVLFEAKSTAGPRLPFGKDGVTETQLGAIHNWSMAGAVVFVLWRVERGDEKGTYLLTENAFKMAASEGRKSVAPGHGAYPVEQGKGFVTVNFIELMRRLWLK